MFQERREYASVLSAGSQMRLSALFVILVDHLSSIMLMLKRAVHLHTARSSMSLEELCRDADFHLLFSWYVGICSTDELWLIGSVYARQEDIVGNACLQQPK